MERRSLAPSLSVLGRRVASLVGGRLLVWSPFGSTVFRSDGSKDPVQPVRSAPEPPPGDSAP